LTWDAPADDGGTPVQAYVLWRRLVDGGSSLELALVPATTLSFEDLTVANGVRYAYWLTARNLAGDSNGSAEVTVMPAGPPSVPLDLVAEGHNGSVTLSWEPPEWNGGLPVIGYRLYRLSDTNEREMLAGLGEDEREFVHEGLVNGEVYRYAVQALTPAGSSELSQVTDGRPAGAPSTPQALIAVWMDGMVHVTWSSPASDGGAPLTGYWVRRTDWDPGNWTEVPAPGMVFSDVDVEHNSTYNYTLYAVNDVGAGPVVRISITTPPPEDDPDDGTAGPWPWLLLGASLAVLAVAVLHWRRREPVTLVDEDAEEG
jgi:titin